MKCKNCGHTFEGRYCNHCGQKAHVDRLTWRSFMAELTESVFQVNHGWLYTMASLSTRPGSAIRGYLNGERKKYFKPVAYLLLMCTLYYITSRVFGTNSLIDDMISGYNQYEAPATSDSDGVLPFLSWVSHNFAYGILMVIPVIALASRIAFFRLGYNYIEHVVITSYITGHQMLIYAACAIIGAWGDMMDIWVFISVLTAALYRLWTYLQFFQDLKKINVVFRLVLFYLIFIFLLYVMIGVTSFALRQ